MYAINKVYNERRKKSRLLDKTETCIIIFKRYCAKQDNANQQFLRRGFCADDDDVDFYIFQFLLVAAVAGCCCYCCSCCRPINWNFNQSTTHNNSQQYQLQIDTYNIERFRSELNKTKQNKKKSFTKHDHFLLSSLYCNRSAEEADDDKNDHHQRSS